MAEPAPSARSGVQGPTDAVRIPVNSAPQVTGVSIPSTVARAAAMEQQQPPAPAIQRGAMGDIELRKYYSPTVYRSFIMPAKSQEALEAAFEAAEQLYPNMTTFNPFTGEVGLENGSKEELGNNQTPEAAAAVRAWKLARGRVAEFFGIWISSIPKYQPGEAGPVNGRTVTAVPQNSRSQKLANDYADPTESFAMITAIAEEANPGHAPDGRIEAMLTSAHTMITGEWVLAGLKEKQYENREALQQRIARESESPVLLSWGLQIYLQDKDVAVTSSAASGLKRKLEADLLAQRRDKPSGALKAFKNVFYKVRDRIRPVHGEELSPQEKEWIEAIVAQAIPKNQRKQVLRNLKIGEPQDTLLELLVMPTLLAGAGPDGEELIPGGARNWSDAQRDQAFQALPERLKTQYLVAAQ